MMNQLTALMIVLITVSVISANIIIGVSPMYQCNGSLIISHEDDKNELGKLVLNGRPNTSLHRFPNIKRKYAVIRNRDIFCLTISGDCCWELYSKNRFKGERQIIYPSDDLFYPDFQPLSIKKLDCP